MITGNILIGWTNLVAWPISRGKTIDNLTFLKPISERFQCVNLIYIHFFAGIFKTFQLIDDKCWNAAVTRCT